MRCISCNRRLGAKYDGEHAACGVDKAGPEPLRCRSDGRIGSDQIIVLPACVRTELRTGTIIAEPSQQIQMRNC